jgi:hypothetical protein
MIPYAVFLKGNFYGGSPPLTEKRTAGEYRNRENMKRGDVVKTNDFATYVVREVTEDVATVVPMSERGVTVVLPLSDLSCGLTRGKK